MMSKKLFSLILILLLSGCGLIKPYRIDIPQGNVVDAQKVAELRPGMSRAQVQYLLGTSLLTDPFHDNRVDYVDYREDTKGDVTIKRAVIYYDSKNNIVSIGRGA